MRVRPLLFLAAAMTLAAQDEFAHTIRPALTEHCGTCHNPANPKNKIDFLKAAEAKDIESARGVWRNVAAQLRNRTMPPMASKLTEQDRLNISTWIDQRLKVTACSGGDQAGPALVRRLNRREYRNSIRDLLGVDLAVHDIFPVDGSGGEGFDTNTETLFLPPMLMERYLEAAQTVLDRSIITPPQQRTVLAYDMAPAIAPAPAARRPIVPGEELTATFTIYADAEYNITISMERPVKGGVDVGLKLDGADAGKVHFQRYDTKGGATRSKTIRLFRGQHTISVSATTESIELYHLALAQRAQEPSSEKKAVHYRLFGLEPGEAPSDPRLAARRFLKNFASKAYRRPVDPSEIDRFLALYERSAERGDPYEERVKLALKAVLVSPAFLFRIEQGGAAAGTQPLQGHELASRLSYFLWSTMPDEQLGRAALDGKLSDPAGLAAETDRLLDSPRSRAFANAFIGQWLGTQDVGGRVAPTLGEVQHFYTPDVAADMREEPILLFHHVLSSNRSLLDLLNGNYTFLTERLMKFYEVNIPGVRGNVFQKAEWPDSRRGGLFGTGAVLALTSHFKQTSPVLRGAWVMETLLGTTVPAPPPDVPPLETPANKELKLSVRQKLVKHREDPACATCHNLMDPIGFGLENFDWLGRWRDTDNGVPVDASGEMPSGEKFNGPVELRQVLLNRKQEFLRNLTAKVLGYALGRPLHDSDQCAVQRIVDAVEKDGYKARTLIREVVLSVPFRNTQGGPAQAAEPPAPKKRPRPLIDK